MSVAGNHISLAKRMSMAAFVSLMISVATLAVGVHAGNAYSTLGTGTPGAVTFPTYVNAYYTLTTPGAWPEFTTGTVDVYRSSGYSGTQIATVTQSVLVGPNTWAPVVTNTQTMTLAANTYGWTSPVAFSLHVTGGDFRVATLIQWKTPAGALIGQRLISYDGPSDYQCHSQGILTCLLSSSQTGSFVIFY